MDEFIQEYQALENDIENLTPSLAQFSFLAFMMNIGKSYLEELHDSLLMAAMPPNEPENEMQPLAMERI